MRLRNLFVQDQPGTPGEAKTLSKLDRRVSALPTHDLIPWAEQCIYAIGRGLSDYARDPSQVHMVTEAEQGAETLLVLIQELKARTS